MQIEFLIGTGLLLIGLGGMLWLWATEPKDDE